VCGVVGRAAGVVCPGWDATAKDKRKFGKGDPRGVLGPESANNSVEAGDLIPTLLFGIPGGVPAAMLLGMLLTYGIQPGPAIINDHLDLMYLIVWSLDRMG